MTKRGKQTVPLATMADQAANGSANVTHAADHGPRSATPEEPDRDGSKAGRGEGRSEQGK
jgi:hypothetical protein